MFQMCFFQEIISFYRIINGKKEMKLSNRIEELIENQSLKCSKCDKEIMDEWEYHDNNGVCDDCYSIPLKKSRGLIIN